MTLENTSESRPIRPRTGLPEVGAFGTSQDTLKRITGMIELGTVIVNSLIALRFLLKLMAANAENAFAQLVYFLTAPFLALFVGLTDTPSFEGIVIEFYDLIAIVVYFALGWALIRVLWILFARLKP
jgi:YggT family protein